MGVTNVTVGDVLTSNAQTLVNTVNCVGVMGKGVALAFKKQFSNMYRDYVERCRRGEVRLTKPYLYTQLVGPWILNFPTKDHWRSVSRLSDIVAGLEYLAGHYKQWGITSLAVPPLGSGSGQLDWNVAGPTLYRHLNQLDIPVEMYAPHGTPNEQLTMEFLAGNAAAGAKSGPLQQTARLAPESVALVSVVSRILREPHHWPVGRTTFQKIAYFLTEAGVPTRLRYQRSSFGPFSADLKPVIAKLVNHEVLVERKSGNMFEIAPGPTYPDARRLYIDDLKSWAPAIERVADLFLRIPRTHDAEVAATVHFAAKELSGRLGRRPTEMEVLFEVKNWKVRRRPPLEDRDVADTIRHLNLLRWIDLEPSLDLPVNRNELMYA